jgi:hypothetical protein
MLAFSYDGSASSPSWGTVTGTEYSRITGSTTFGGTGAANINLDDNDFFLFASLSPDDASSNHDNGANMTLTATGATLGTLTKVGTGVTTTGGDTSMFIALREVTAGASTAAPVAGSLTSNSSETGGGVFLRIRAVGILGTPATPVPSVTAAITSVGTAVINTTATVVTAAVVAVAGVPAPTVTTGGAPANAPGSLAAVVVSVPAPTIKLDHTVTTSVVPAVAAVPAPTITRSATVVSSTVSALAL